MDFGDIFDKWEKQDNKVHDKDAENTDMPINVHDRRRRLKNKRPEAELDIHGLTREQAWLSLETFFEEAGKNDLGKVQIIHGKGNHSSGSPVLKRTVMDFIEQCPLAGESGRGKAAAGGEGVTWVLLKKPGNPNS